MGEEGVSSRPPTVIDRYFHCRYNTNVPKAGEDQLVLTHSNRVCVICLAQTHPIIREQKKVTSVDFKVDGINRLDNKVSGKSKRGAQYLKGNSPLCKIHCADGSSYTPVSCIKGQLIEVNTNLIDHPELLTEKTNGENYMAVVLPILKSFDSDMKRLKTSDEYHALQAGTGRSPPTPTT